MIRSDPAPNPLEDGPFRTEEEQSFWKALVDLTTMENANQGALATFVGVSQGYVSKILSGKQIPKSRLRRRFADFFKLSYEDMLALGRQRLESQSYAQDAGSRRCHDAPGFYNLFPCCSGIYPLSSPESLARTIKYAY